MRSVARVISQVGSTPVFFLFSLLLFFFSNKWFFLPLFLMVVISTIICYSIKWWFPTERPVVRTLKYKKNFFTHWMYVNLSSFPSAHTSVGVGFTTIVFFFSWEWSFLAALFAGTVAWTRVYLKRHYLRDIIGGVVIGIVSGVLAWYLAPFFVPFF